MSTDKTIQISDDGQALLALNLELERLGAERKLLLHKAQAIEWDIELNGEQARAIHHAMKRIVETGTYTIKDF